MSPKWKRPKENSFDKALVAFKLGCNIRLKKNFWKPSALSLSYFNVERIDDVVNDELEIGMTKPMLNIALPSSEVVVSDDDLVALQHELVHQVRADEPGAARDENPPPVLVV